jgi:hypothetical protein
LLIKEIHMTKKSAEKSTPKSTKASRSPAPAAAQDTNKSPGSEANHSVVKAPRSLGKKQLARAAALVATDAPLPRQLKTESFASSDFEQLPHVSAVAGAALQADIVEVNRAIIRLLKTAARMGSAEPLSPILLGTTQEMIDLFFSPSAGERLLSQSIGFPLFQLRIHDVGVMRQLLSDGLVSATSVQALTKTFPLEVVQTSTRQRRF